MTDAAGTVEGAVAGPGNSGAGIGDGAVAGVGEDELDPPSQPTRIATPITIAPAHVQNRNSVLRLNDNAVVAIIP